jgi:hypothetical protein
LRVVAKMALAVLTVSAGGVLAQAQEEPKTAAETAPPEPSAAPAQGMEASLDKSKVVYVSDFELEPTAQPENKPAAAAGPPEPRTENAAAEQAKMLVEFMSTTLVKELEKAGYTARRMRPNQARPEEGIQIKGVFAEPDAQNHLRRAVFGQARSVGSMALFVGIGNLAKPDQALYAVVDPRATGETADGRSGALINVSAYAPVAKFEMPKAVTEKAVADTAAAIVADLKLLLGSNFAAAKR